MKLRVLGCSGSIGGPGAQTSAFLIDQDILIDAGTGVLQLSLDEMVAVQHVFLTHAHMDHLAALPMLVEATSDKRERPLTIHALPAVLDTLREHIFNWAVWPDFAVLPTPDKPAMSYCPLSETRPVQLGGRVISCLPAKHTVPATAYRVQSASGSIVFSGDSGPCDEFWNDLTTLDDLKHLIVECTFPNRLQTLADLSLHYTPNTLSLAVWPYLDACALHLTHSKPDLAEEICRELGDAIGREPKRLSIGQKITL